MKPRKEDDAKTAETTNDVINLWKSITLFVMFFIISALRTAPPIANLIFLILVLAVCYVASLLCNVQTATQEGVTEKLLLLPGEEKGEIKDASAIVKIEPIKAPEHKEPEPVKAEAKVEIEIKKEAQAPVIVAEPEVKRAPPLADAPVQAPAPAVADKPLFSLAAEEKLD